MSDLEQAAKELTTVRDFVRWGASRMNNAGLHFGHGTASAIDETAQLVLFGLHLPMDVSSEYFGAALTCAEKQHVVALIDERIRERKPAAYITHEAWFMGLTFYVDNRVLVPRSPIAEMIEHRFAPWAEEAEVHDVLDLCTGSGCIGIACAYAFPEAHVALGDISPDALAVAQRNIEEHGLDSRVEAIESDLLAAMGDRTFDIIVSNPPYVPQDEFDALPTEFSHEPDLGLLSGERGLHHAYRIMLEAPAYMNEGGILVVEVGNSWHALMDVLPDVPFTWVNFERGGEGVYLLTKSQLLEHAGTIRSVVDHV